MFRNNSNRLEDFNYSSENTYFITICSHNRKEMFGEFVDGVMILNDIGRMVERCLIQIPNHFNTSIVDSFIVMPNHLHAVIYLIRRGVTCNAPTKGFFYSQISPKTGSLSVIIRTFKAAVTNWCRKNTDIHKLWQGNYYDHIIRNEQELENIRRYIHNNPMNWDIDIENKSVIKKIDSLKNYKKLYDS